MSLDEEMRRISLAANIECNRQMQEGAAMSERRVLHVQPDAQCYAGHGENPKAYMIRSYVGEMGRGPTVDAAWANAWDNIQDKQPHCRFDAGFYAFQELSKLADALLPKGYQLTKEQSDAIHACAKRMAADLLSGTYE